MCLLLEVRYNDNTIYEFQFLINLPQAFTRRHKKPIALYTSVILQFLRRLSPRNWDLKLEFLSLHTSDLIWKR